MEKIPTAEEWLKHFEENAYPGTPISECIIEFAKLHVEAAIKECIECAPTSSTDAIYHRDVVVCLTDCYPLSNIK